MNCIIRRANIDDAKVLDALLTKLIQDEKNYDNNINESFTVNNYYANLIDDSSKCFLVAEINNKIIGYLYGYIIDNDKVCLSDGAKIDALFILDEYRQLGIAKSLIAEFKSWALNNNANYVEVSVLNNNTKAYNLYENVGFKNIKTTMITEIN